MMRKQARFRSRALTLCGSICFWLGLTAQGALAQPLAAEDIEEPAGIPDAASLGATISFGEAWQRVQAGNPDVQALDDLDAAWGHRARQAGAYPNPSLAVSAEDIGAREQLFGQTQWTFALSQPIPLGSRLGAGQGVEEASRTAWRQEAALVGRGIKARLKILFIRVLSARKKLVTLQASTMRFQEVRKVARARVDAGSLPLARLQRVEQVLSLEQEAVVSLERDILGATAELPALWGGKPGDVAKLAGHLAEPLPLSDLPTGLAGLGDIPEMKGCVARVGQWEAEAELREQEAIPDLDVGAGYRGVDGFDSHALVLAVSVPLPVFNRNQSAIDEARARKRAEEFSCRGILARAEAQAAALHAQASALQAQFLRTRDVLIPQATVAHGAALEALVRGDVDINDMLGLAEHLVGLELMAASIQEEYWLAVAEYETLTGAGLLSFDEVTP
jgi:cobalt-zinc-cadmium efflux system outer membrane protein